MPQPEKPRFDLSAFNRRTFLGAGGLLGASLTSLRLPVAAAQESRISELVIDLGTEPVTLDPATTYDADGWSIVHSIFDSLLQYGADGVLTPLLAETFTLVDPQTYRVVLRSGITFHNGEALDARSIEATLAHITAEETASQVAANFSVIESLDVIDDLTVDFRLSAPAPWLPAQVAAWFCLLPPEASQEPDFFANPIGTGPYQFESITAGERVSLSANPGYFAASPKGQPIADRLAYRFVADATTRVADLLSGTAQIIRNVPIDQIGAVEDSGDLVLQTPISGCAFIRSSHRCRTLFRCAGPAGRELRGRCAGHHRRAAGRTGHSTGEFFCARRTWIRSRSEPLPIRSRNGSPASRRGWISRRFRNIDRRHDHRASRYRRRGRRDAD